jgi:hypothetical protein
MVLMTEGDILERASILSLECLRRDNLTFLFCGLQFAATQNCNWRSAVGFEIDGSLDDMKASDVKQSLLEHNERL